MSLRILCFECPTACSLVRPFFPGADHDFDEIVSRLEVLENAPVLRREFIGAKRECEQAGAEMGTFEGGERTVIS